MGKSVVITLKGIQSNKDEEVIELMTVGTYSFQDNRHSITYEETELTGMQGTTTTLIVDGDRVTLQRMGETNTHIIFEQGKRHVSCYETPYGSLSIGVHADNVNISVGDNGGEISAKYNIEINNAAAGVNNFYMKFEPAAGVEQLTNVN